MFEIKNPISLTPAVIKSANLCNLFDPVDLKNIGEECYAGYERDERSRDLWMRRNEAGMNLALQITTEKTFPWPGASNVAFPLVTIAAQQFHARAYPAIVSSPNIVNAAVVGDDPKGDTVARAERISTHMSWQLLYQDKAWEEQQDKTLLNLSIIGTTFKKSYFSSAVGHNVSDLVHAKDLVLNYWAKSVEACERKTHKIPLFRNEVYEKVMRGVYRDVLEESWYTSTPPVPTSQQRAAEDRRQGVTIPQSDDASALLFGEQHVSMDLDADGYAEPYIITFHLASKEVVRIVTRFESESAIERAAAGKYKGKIIRITPTEYFTKYTFIPSPDGGIYDIGFGIFLGPLNETVNSLVNMLLDAGTMQTTGGGFLARGAKIRGGQQSFSPFEWKRVDSTGDDLRKSIFPLPVNEPSQVLFQLLSLLINYTNRISGTTDMMVGENPGQNTPAETSRTMVEMGQKIYTAIFKRVWRSAKEEFQKLYRLNSIYLEFDKTYVGGATRDDYATPDFGVEPSADPNITSDSMAMQQAMAIKQAAMTTMGYNKDAVERRYLKAMKVPNIQEVFPGSEGMPPPTDPKITIAEMKLKGQQMELEAQREEFTITMMEERRVNNAKILELMAKAENESANAQTEQAYAQVALINAEIAAVKNRNDHLNKQIEFLLKGAKIESDHRLGVQGMAAASSDAGSDATAGAEA